jgi:hypothetical protein
VNKPTCKFIGRFPGKTQVSFTANIPSGAVTGLQTLLERSFERVMAEEFPNIQERPKLRRLLITISKP